MRQQLALPDLAQKLHQDRFNKHDFVADTRQLAMNDDGELVLQDINGNRTWEINNHMHGQLASRLDIPKKHYDRLLTKHPDLLAHQVSHLFDREHERRMVRTLDGTARAFLSDKFRIDMDNYDVANAALPVLQGVQGMEVLSCGVTDTRMYIKAQFPRLRAEVKRGDVVTAGIVISNSEVGAGSLRIEALLYRLICLNGMIAGELLRKFHVGTRHGLDDNTFEVLTQETREKTAEAMKAVIHDVTKAATDATRFNDRITQLIDTTKEKVTGDVPKAIEVLGNRLNLTQDEESSVLRHLIQGGDLSRWGVANAVTAASQNIDDYDRATEFERFGGNVIDLNKSDWEEIALAA